MPKRGSFQVPRTQPGGIDPGSNGRKANVRPIPAIDAGWIGRMQASHAGAKEVMVKISGGGRDADGVRAHFEYIDRHGKLNLETDRGEVPGQAGGTPSSATGRHLWRHQAAACASQAWWRDARAPARTAASVQSHPVDATRHTAREGAAGGETFAHENFAHHIGTR
jgi:hypothetical protein